MKQTRNSKLLAEFTAYCKANPEQRFWQALCNWSGAEKIVWQDSKNDVWQQQFDTFYYEERNK